MITIKEGEEFQVKSIEKFPQITGENIPKPRKEMFLKVQQAYKSPNTQDCYTSAPWNIPKLEETKYHTIKSKLSKAIIMKDI